MGFAVSIIYGITFLCWLIWNLKNLSKSNPVSSRGLYIMLAITTFISILYDALLETLKREEDMAVVTTFRIYTVLTILRGAQDAFLPAAALYLIHKRGAALRIASGITTVPIACKAWFLVGATFSTYIAVMGIKAAVYHLRETGNSYRIWGQYDEARRGLGHTTTALEILLALDVIISLIIQSSQAKRTSKGDLISCMQCGRFPQLIIGFQVIRRLFVVAAPFSATYAIESPIFAIDGETAGPEYDPLALDLAIVSLDGLCRIMITTGLLMTMSLPSPQWRGPTGTYPSRTNREGSPHRSRSGTDEHLLEKSYAP